MSASKVLTSKPTGKILLGIPRLRWEENIRMDTKQIGVSTMNWVDSTQDSDWEGCIVPPYFLSFGVI